MTAKRSSTRVPFNVRGIALVASSHVVDDLYQGIVPALLPFFVAERQYSYAAISGITLAATVLSSVAQPLFGVWTDKRARRWMIGGGISLAAVGVALAGYMPNYPLTWIVIALSGLGIAAFHPEAARAARQAAGRSNTGMSIFALGGNTGYALGSFVATPVLLAFGLRGTVLLLVPAVVMVGILARYLTPTLERPTSRGTRPALPTGRDNWPAFLTLTVIVVIRSILFFGFTSFVALYFINHLGTSQATGGAALTTFLVCGALGTLLGGWLGDRFHPLIPIRAGFVLSVPTLAGVLWVDSVPVAFLLTAAAGVAMFLSFSVFVLLGQDYLPNRIGTASGMTVGLGASIGGLANPLIGWLADATTLRTALVTLLVLPVIALIVAMFLTLPDREEPGDDPAVAGGVGADTPPAAP
jgi:FSR family fosmidomycin resistance protein-like MFS transporter